MSTQTKLSPEEILQDHIDHWTADKANWEKKLESCSMVDEIMIKSRIATAEQLIEKNQKDLDSLKA